MVAGNRSPESCGDGGKGKSTWELEVEEKLGIRAGKGRIWVKVYFKGHSRQRAVMKEVASIVHQKGQYITSSGR